jgi:hypothetical protein
MLEYPQLSPLNPPYLLEFLRMSIVVRAARIGSIGLILGLSAFSHPSAKADTAQQAPLSNPEANSDPFSSRGDNNGAIMQMIHRAMRGDANVDRVAESAAQRENLSEAANDFFAKRNQRLKKPTASPIVQPATTIAPTAPNQSGILNPGMVAPSQPITPGAGVTSPEPQAESVTVPQPAQP